MLVFQSTVYTLFFSLSIIIRLVYTLILAFVPDQQGMQAYVNLLDCVWIMDKLQVMALIVLIGPVVVSERQMN